MGSIPFKNITLEEEKGWIEVLENELTLVARIKRSSGKQRIPFGGNKD